MGRNTGQSILRVIIWVITPPHSLTSVLRRWRERRKRATKDARPNRRWNQTQQLVSLSLSLALCFDFERETRVFFFLYFLRNPIFFIPIYLCVNCWQRGAFFLAP